MSSINPFYTFHYSQPAAYRFSHDSVFLARKVFELNLNFKNYRMLDLCAGCGIIGLDYLYHCEKDHRELPTQSDFVEVQEDYSEHFERNRVHVSSPTRFLLGNFNALQLEPYDLIFCNPPYFESNTGSYSPNHFKNRCRFFLDSTFIELTKTIECLLKSNGKAFVLSRTPLKTQLVTHRLPNIRGNLLTQIDGATTN